MKLVFLLLTSFSALGTQSDQFDYKCKLCHKAVQGIHSFSLHQDNYSYLIQLAKDLCVKYGEDTWFDICNQLIDVFKQVVIDALMDRIFDFEYVCRILNQCPGPNYIEENFEFYVEGIMRDKPSERETEDGGETYKFVHISDIHIDLLYKAGSNENCGTPQCCREGKGSAGQWGGYNCDLPLITLESVLSQINSLNPDFVIITGDFPPHDVWNQSKESNLNYQSTVAKAFLNLLPNTKLFPIYGNHACYPINQCKLGKANWIPEPFIRDWKLSPSHLQSLKYRGGYSEKFRKNLRLIALDTNTNNCGNLQISKNSTDPLSQLNWLYLQLLEAEKNNEKVFIFGHISPGDVDSLGIWGQHFNVLMDRFEYTVAGQFYGHSHLDQIHVNRGVYSKKPTSVQWVAPSLTTYTNNNPAFRVFEADLNSNRLIEIYQYRMNLLLRNKSKEKPVWELAYKFRELYGVKDIEPGTILDIGNRMDDDEDLAKLYTNQSFGSQASKHCDADCRHYYHCLITQGVIDDIIACQGPSEEGLLSLFLQQLFSKWSYKLS